MDAIQSNLTKNGVTEFPPEDGDQSFKVLVSILSSARFYISTAGMFVALFGMGCVTSIKDFDDKDTHLSKSVVIGLAFQSLIQPLIGYGLALLLDMGVNEALAMIMLGCSPVSPLCAVLVYYGDGVVIVGMCLAMFSTALSIGLIPFCKCPAYSRKTDAGPTEAHYDQRILTKLLQNYRSHPDVLKLPNQMFYDQELKVFADELVRETFCRWDQLPKQGFPIIFHGVEGQDEREEQSPSFFNKSEIEIVVDYVKKVMEKRGGQKIKQEDIGVISPYRKQVQKLRQVLKKRRYDDIKVGSVEEFQGQERTVIIISTVRSTKAEYIEMDIDFKLGFLKNPKRFNVAVTRAKALLIIVGNPFMLSKDEHWNQMLEFCIQKGGYKGCTYSAEEGDVDSIIDLLKKVHMGTVPTEEEAEEEFGFSQVAQQNDPEWRAED